MKKLVLFLLPLSLCSCKFLFNQAVSPNRCKQCKVVRVDNREVLWREEGCGGNTANMEQRAKSAAYDLSRNSGDFCSVEVMCNVWRENEE